MERYSRLYGTSPGNSASGPQELGCSAGLPTFMRQLGIMNLQSAFEDTAQQLSSFRKLPRYDDAARKEPPVLIRYSPIELGRRDNWADDVLPFIGLSASGLDARGAVYHHTHFFKRELLLSKEEYNYLDHIFGAHFVTASEKDGSAAASIDYDAPPACVEPVLREEDAVLVRIVAAAVIKQWSVLLRLEKGCVFNRRARELLIQIYSLLPPVLAARIGFSAYQDPAQIPQLIQQTPIRLFLTPAECSGSVTADRLLVLDLNQELAPQIAGQRSKGFLLSKPLLTSVSHWYSLPWRERQPLMELFFANPSRPIDEQLFSDTTRSFALDPFIRWLNRKPDQGTITSLEELKEKYDSFPLCAQVPVLHEKFIAAVPGLLKSPLTPEQLVAQAADRLSGADENAAALYSFGQSLLVRPAPVQPPQPIDPAPQSTAASAVPPRSQVDTAEYDRQIAQLKQQLAQQSKDHASALEAMKQQSVQDLRRALQTQQTEYDGQLQQLNLRLQDLQKEYAAAVEALELASTQAQSHQHAQADADEINLLYEQNSKLHSENEALRQAQDTQIQQMHADFTEILEQLQLTHRAELEQLKKGHADELAAAEKTCTELYEAEIAQLKLDHADKLAAEKKSLAETYEVKIEQQKKDHADELAAAEKTCAELYEAEIAQLKLDHAGALAAERKSLEKAYEAEIEQLKLDHDSELAAAEKTCAELYEAEIEELKVDHAAELAAEQKSLAEAYEAKIERLNQGHADELAAAKRSLAEAYVSKIEQLNQSHADELTAEKRALAEAYLSKIEQLKRDHAAQLAGGIEAGIAAELEKLKAAHAAEITKLNLAHASQLSTEKHILEEAHNAEVSALNTVHKEELAAAKQALDETTAAHVQLMDTYSTAREKLNQLQRDAHSAEEVKKELTDAHNAELEQLKQQYTSELDTMKQSLAESHSAEIASLGQKHAEELAAAKQDWRNSHNAAIAALEQKHTSELDAVQQSLAESHSAEIAALEQKYYSELAAAERSSAESHSAEIEALEQKHYSELTAAERSLAKSHRAEIAALEQKHYSELAAAKRSLVESHNTKIEQLKLEHDSKLAAVQQSLSESHNAEIEQLKLEHAGELAAANQAWENSHSAAIAALEQKHASELASEIEAGIAEQLKKIDIAHAADIAQLRQAHANELATQKQAAEQAAASAVAAEHQKLELQYRPAAEQAKQNFEKFRDRAFARIRTLENDLSAAEKKIQQLEKVHADGHTIPADCDAEIAKLKQDRDAAVAHAAQLEKDHEAEITKLQQGRDDAIVHAAQLEKDHETEINKLKQIHSNELAELSWSIDKRVADAIDAERQKTNQNYADAFQKQKEQYEAKIAMMAERIRSYEAERDTQQQPGTGSATSQGTDPAPKRSLKFWK